MMRRSSTKRGSAPAAPAANVTGVKSANKELEKIDTLFLSYADRHEEACIGPEGVELFCRDLGLDPSDVRILLFAWKLQAARMGYFSQEEWRRGLRVMRVDSIDKLKKALPALQNEVASPHLFADFYKFAFEYCLTEPRQKTLDLDTACTMLDLVMAGRPHHQTFIQFLMGQTEYKAINLDQWTAFLRFSQEVRPDFSNYDENMAWPLLMDNYVEWGRQHFLAPTC
eukprot:jgi/Mesen1/8330/ME000046S07719